MSVEVVRQWLFARALMARMLYEEGHLARRQMAKAFRDHASGEYSTPLVLLNGKVLPDERVHRQRCRKDLT